MKPVWKGIDVMRGHKRKNNCKTLEGNVEYGNDLNKFYARFDCPDFDNER